MPTEDSTQSPEVNSETPKSETPKKSKKNRILIAFGIIIILVLIGVIIYLLTRPEPKPADDTGIRGTVVTEDNVDQLRDEPIEAGYYECSMNVDWNFKDSSTPSYDAYVANVETNTNTVYFDLTLEDTGELVYSSPYIPLGGELTDIKLDVNLKAGDYPAVVTYHLVDEEKNILSNVSVGLTLHIEN